LKYLLLVIVIVVVYWVFKSYKIRTRGGRSSSAGRAEDMVCCAQCGVHLPRSESVLSGEAFYCSPEHRRLRESAQ
jgi:uncharacterized protein